MLGPVVIVWIIIFILFYDYCSHKRSSPPSTSPTLTSSTSTSQNNLQTEDRSKRIIIEKNPLGCLNKDAFDSLQEYSYQKDTIAFKKAFFDLLSNGECILFQKGETVFVMDFSLSGMAKVRIEGDTKEYWISRHAISKSN